MTPRPIRRLVVVLPALLLPVQRDAVAAGPVGSEAARERSFQPSPSGEGVGLVRFGAIESDADRAAGAGCCDLSAHVAQWLRAGAYSIRIEPRDGWGRPVSPGDLAGSAEGCECELVIRADGSIACSSFIAAGTDRWTTPCGEGAAATRFSFASNRIPPGLFGPGSQPFEGEVRLCGRSAGSDTRVERLEDLWMPAAGSKAVTRARVVSLDLVSCEPISIVFDRGMAAERTTSWQVDVDLSPFRDAPEGIMTVERTGDCGGMFAADLTVHPRFVFTNTDTGERRTLDAGMLGWPAEPLDFTTRAWLRDGAAGGAGDIELAAAPDEDAPAAARSPARGRGEAASHAIDVFARALPGGG